MVNFCNDLKMVEAIAQMLLNISNLTSVILLRGTCGKKGLLHLDFSALWPQGLHGGQILMVSTIHAKFRSLLRV